MKETCSDMCGHMQQTSSALRRLGTRDAVGPGFTTDPGRRAGTGEDCHRLVEPSTGRRGTMHLPDQNSDKAAGSRTDGGLAELWKDGREKVEVRSGEACSLP